MRKRIINPHPSNTGADEVDWLPLEQIALVEVTSEEPSHPIEDALLPGAATGWRAALPGEQTIRLIFDNPQSLRHIRLLFLEPEVERFQEFVLRWSSDDGQTFHEIVRQQWNFSPRGSTQEMEDYHVELSDMIQLELKIVPEKSGGTGMCIAGAAPSRLILAQIHALIGDLGRFDIATRHRQRIPTPGVAQVEGIGLVACRPRCPGVA